MRRWPAAVFIHKKLSSFSGLPAFFQKFCARLWGVWALPPWAAGWGLGPAASTQPRRSGLTGRVIFSPFTKHADESGEVQISREGRSRGPGQLDTTLTTVSARSVRTIIIRPIVATRCSSRIDRFRGTRRWRLICSERRRRRRTRAGQRGAGSGRSGCSPRTYEREQGGTSAHHEGPTHRWLLAVNELSVPTCASQ